MAPDESVPVSLLRYSEYPGVYFPRAPSRAKFNQYGPKPIRDKCRTKPGQTPGRCRTDKPSSGLRDPKPTGLGMVSYSYFNFQLLQTVANGFRPASHVRAPQRQQGRHLVQTSPYAQSRASP